MGITWWGGSPQWNFLTAKFDSQQALPFISYLSQSSHYPYYTWCDVVHLSTVLGFTILSMHHRELCEFSAETSDSFHKKAHPDSLYAIDSEVFESERSSHLHRPLYLTHMFLVPLSIYICVSVPQSTQKSCIYSSFHHLYIYVYLFLNPHKSLDG